MPGTVQAGVPDAIALQVIQQSDALVTANGDACAEGGNTTASGITCKECKGTSKSPRCCGGCWQVWYCSRAHQVSGWPKHQKDCKPYKIAQSPDLGRYLVATRDIKAGELLLEDPTLIMGPKTITEPVCLACYRPVEGDFSCPDCGFPMCDKDCSSAESHLPECKAVAESGENVRVSLFGEINCMYECIMPVRVLNLRDTNPNVWRKIMNLESHSEKRESTEEAAITQRTVVDILTNRLNLDYNAELINQVLGILDTNAFEIRLPDSSIMGVYGTGALLEHSCIPNTHRTFDADLNLVVRAAVSISRGEHLQSCYTESISPTIMRQEHLLTTKFFSCSCPRCSDPTEFGTYLSAMLCPSCTKQGKPEGLPKDADKNTFGVVIQKDPLSPSSPYVCLTCKAPLDSTYVTRITAVMNEEADELESTGQNIKSCEAFLEKWAPVYHNNYATFVNIKYVLVHLYGNETGYSLDEMSPLMLLRKESLARQILKTADIIVPGISRLRGSVLYELYQAIFYKTCSMFQSGIIPNEMAKKMAQEAYDCLLECARVLSFEPPVQPEGQLGIEAKEELRHMIKWMKEDGWKG